MNPRTKRAALVGAASAMALSLTACGSIWTERSNDAADKAAARQNQDLKIGVLLPEKEAARYEKFDYPHIKKEVEDLTSGKGRVLYANAEQNAKRQERQVDQMVADRVDVLILDAVDSRSIKGSVKKAKDAGIAVIAYDRLAEGPVDGYVSFDSDQVGHVQGDALLTAIGSKASKKSRIVMMNGSVTDPNAALFKAGALAELKYLVTISKSYDTKDWKPENARANMAAAIEAIGAQNIAGVYSANDGMAGGIITALKAAGVTHLPPVTGQDAELAAVQRIVTGDQYMTVYKPYPEEASTAAQLAVLIAQQRGIEFNALAKDRVDSPTTPNVPSLLVQVVPMTQSNIKSTVVKDGIYKVGDICTAKYVADCTRIGLK
ncbi:sugar ABC transporter substrate-binding protein [Streptomyces sp. NPDC057717]|uniref:sugar ABC transporter substrate-binding protein n=1 Tax=Streptomyces sp. NPDC057717 TaxID=3346224 RepID=UPI003695B771